MELLDNIKATYARCLEIVEKKNLDYATAADPFRNFRSSLVVGVDIERAMLVRIMDKIGRISNLLDKPPAVSDESLEDSILDAINYLALLKARRTMAKTGN